MSNKNPFEIRAEMLAMAKDYLDKQQELNVQFAQKAFDEAVKAGQATAGMWKEFLPKMYTPEEIMKQAQEFYSFVSNPHKK